MIKVALVSLFALFLCVSAVGQEAGGLSGTSSYGYVWSYSPDSSHMLIGMAQQRSTWTAGVEFTHRIKSGENLRLDYEASYLPAFVESDPTIIATTTTLGNNTFVMPQTPVRVVYVDHKPVGTARQGNLTAPIYPIYGRQSTYGSSFAPIGARFSAMPYHRIQPSVSVDMGFVVSSRDLPVDGADRFNYMFSFGPGVQVFLSPRTSVRMEYLYRHISNAHQGFQNPGVDQGTLRVTLSRHK